MPNGDETVDRTGIHQPAAGAPGSANDTRPLPARIGRFEIRAVLGAGAFGRVYRAFDPNLGREVAIKVPLDGVLKNDADRERFLREARAAATVSHPGVCPIHEVGEDAGRPYIVMALVPGQSLDAVLKSRKGPLPEKQAVLTVRKIALGLEAAHRKGVVHRDLKPANVMFDSERKDVVVADFGLARGPRPADAEATQSGVIMGTPAYMSPEQARGDTKGVGPATDIFSLGVVLYELLAGCRPFTGTTVEILGQILHVEAAPPSKHRPDTDPRLDVVCKKAMAKDPEKRFRSMKEFAAALEEVLRSAETVTAVAPRSGNEPPGEVRDPDDVFTAMPEARRGETAVVVEPATPKRRTPPWMFVGLGLLLLGGLVAAAGAVFLTRPDTPEVTFRQVEEPRREPPPGDGFVPLFNGADYSGWQRADGRPVTGGWAVREGAMVRNQEEGPGDIWTREQYGDFVLELECTAGGNGGVFLRSAGGMNCPEVQIDAPGRGPRLTSFGAFCYLKAPVKENAVRDDWNRMRITASGSSLRLEVNGELVNEMDLDRWTEIGKNPDGTSVVGRQGFGHTIPAKDFPRHGRIGLQAFGSDVAYRNIRVKVLPAK